MGIPRDILPLSPSVHLSEIRRVTVLKISPYVDIFLLSLARRVDEGFSCVRVYFFFFFVMDKNFAWLVVIVVATTMCI